MEILNRNIRTIRGRGTVKRLPELTERFRTLRTAAQSYTSFSGKPAEMNGSVRFIYVTDGV